MKNLLLITIFFLINIERKSIISIDTKNCVLHDLNWYQNPNTYHNCIYRHKEWPEKSEFTNKYKQWMRDSLFRIAMEKGKETGDRKCMLYALCEIGCSEMIAYGMGDTNLSKKQGDSEEIIEDINAWHRGQHIASARSEEMCNSSCTNNYPGCSSSNGWYHFYKVGHKIGMTIYYSVITLMDQFSNEETQRKIGNNAFVYVSQLYVVTAKVINFLISISFSTKPWIWIIEIFEIVLYKKFPYI